MRIRFVAFLVAMSAVLAVVLAANQTADTSETSDSSTLPAQVPSTQSSEESSGEAPAAETVATDLAESDDAQAVVDLSTPRDTMRTFRAAVEDFDKDTAVRCLDFSELPDSPSRSKQWSLASNLADTMDRMAVVDLNEISEALSGAPYSFPPGIDDPPIQIQLGEDEQWRFNAATVARIPRLYQKYRDQPKVNDDHWLRDLFPESLVTGGVLLPYYQWISLLVVIFVGFLADHLTRFILNRLVAAWLKLAKANVDRTVQKGVWKPVGLLVMALVWYYGTILIDIPDSILEILLVAVTLFTVIAAVWTSYRLIDLLTSYLAVRALETHTKLDDLLIPLVSRSLKVFATVLGVVVCAESFKLPLTGLLSGLGIGGLAFAFAAKESLGNVFGSLTVLIDRPFEIGDWIKMENIEGSVEAVGIRSTRVRTFYNSQISVPNSLLTTAVVDNLGRRRYRRIKTMLSVEYDTPPQRIEAFCEGIRELIRRHPYTRKDYYHVYLNEFSASSLDILLYCFHECPDWSVELRERQRLFLDILRLAERLDVSFAFPTSTVHLFRDDPSHETEPGGPKHGSSQTDPSRWGRQAAAQLAPLSDDPSSRPGLVEFPGPSTSDDND